MKIIPVILSGGSGTRLWPLSRKELPKQYLSLAGENTMLQETILRLNDLDNLSDPIVVCNVSHRFLVAEQCQQIGIKNPTILLEPIGKNTAPAIVAAALQSLKMVDDAVLLVLSADHVIQGVESFHKAIGIASKQAQESKLTTFGIIPTDANTGYGYIKASENSIDGAYMVKKFVEKPDLATAQSYLEQGNYLWNSGMFMFKATTLIDELTTYSPEIVVSVNNAVDNAKQDLDFIRLEKQAFESSPSDSIDYALMEKSDNVFVVPLDAGWNDIGSWSALHDFGKKDVNGNVIKGDVLTKDSTNTYINADHHMVAAIGVDNLIIVDTPNATLISTKDKSQEVKHIVEQLYQQNREETSYHRKVYRPWGWYDLIETGKYFQVKRLHVKPGAKLSVQMHHQRAEHWVVVSGIATVINGDEVLTLKQGYSTYIPVGTVHALENSANDPLEVIEVQSGTYLGEDDIVRFEDIYGRTDNISTINIKTELGEGAYLDSNSGKFFWVDINQSLLFSYADNKVNKYQIPGNISNVLFLKGCQIYLTNRSGIICYNLMSGKIDQISKTPIQYSSTEYRANDGLKLHDGLYMYGVMRDTPVKNDGALILSKDGITKVVHTGIAIPNTFIRVPDSYSVLITDSFEGVVYKITFDESWSFIISKVKWFDLSHTETTPDGGCISSDGRIFIAIWDGFKIVELDSNGILIQEFKLPIPRPTNCTLDKSENQLFVTSAYEGLTEYDRQKYPLSGFIVMVNISVC